MNIAILGYGTVGKSVEYLANKNNINVKYILMRDIDVLNKENMTNDYNLIINDKDIDCVVECIGGNEPAFSFVKKALDNHINVVTSNKKMLVNNFNNLLNTAKDNNVNILFSAACGGGIPWIKNLIDISKNDNILYLKGIMNGTTNFILSKMDENNLSFNETLKIAQKLGYAERDPSDDINAIDTANKLIISAVCAYKYLFKLNDIFIKGIKNINVQDIEYCKKNNLKIVLLGEVIRINNKFHLSVLPHFVKKETILGNIKDNNNCFILNTENRNVLSLIGQGAGGLPTASNIIKDINELNNPYLIDLKGTKKPNYDLISNKYYIRTKKKLNNNIIDIMVKDNIYITKKITINELKEYISDDDFIGEIDDD